MKLFVKDLFKLLDFPKHRKLNWNISAHWSIQIQGRKIIVKKKHNLMTIINIMND